MLKLLHVYIDITGSVKAYSSILESLCRRMDMKQAVCSETSYDSHVLRALSQASNATPPA